MPQSQYLHPNCFKLGFVASGHPEKQSFETFGTEGMARLIELFEFSETTVLDDAALSNVSFDEERKNLSRRLGSRYSDLLISKQKDGSQIWASKGDRNIEFPCSVSGQQFLEELLSELSSI